MALNSENLRAAMALLRWRVEDTAEHSGVGTNTIARLLRGEPIRESTAAKIMDAVERAGVELLNGSRPGARLKGPG